VNRVDDLDELGEGDSSRGRLRWREGGVNH
jgi:hypothetical protein